MIFNTIEFLDSANKPLPGARPRAPRTILS